MIESASSMLSLTRQCELLGLARSSYYYAPKPESELNLRIMRKIDEQYLITPFYGSRMMTQELKKMGENVNRKRLQRLMKLMSLEAQYPKPMTSLGNKEHFKYPYLLKRGYCCSKSSMGYRHNIHTNGKGIFISCCYFRSF